MVSHVRGCAVVGCLLALGACGSSKPPGTTTTAPDGGGSGGRAGSGGAVGTDAGASRDARGPSACNDGTYALQFAQVTGTVSWNGGRWPSVTGITLVPRLPPAQASAPVWNGTVDATDGTFSVRVPFGEYDLRLYDQQSRNFFHSAVPGGVKAEGDVQVVVDMRTVKISGVVTLAGAAFPTEAGGRGEICFKGPSGDSTTFCGALSEAGPAASYSVDVPRGYEVQASWARSGTVASTTPPGVIPFGSAAMGTYSFDGDQTLNLDVKTPSYVVAGRVTVDGGPVPPAPDDLGIPMPAAEVELGSVKVTMADSSASSFRVRLLDGLYYPMVTVPGVEVVLSWWNGCAEPGCLPMRDNDLVMNVATTAPPAGTVEGKLDFQVPAGRSVVPVSGGLGQVTLVAKSLAPGNNVIPFHGVQTKYTGNADASGHFQFANLPYGTYAGYFEGWDLASVPNGIFPFAGTVVVDRARVTWNQVVPLVAAVIDIRVNGQPMADDSMVNASELTPEPRGQLVFTRGGDTRSTINLGELGPARVERLMIAGQYQVAVDGRTTEGRTYVRGFRQDVLPVGRFPLGTIDIAVPAAGQAAGVVGLDLPVRDVRVTVADIQSVTASGGKFGMVSLVSADGNPFWAEYPAGADSVSLRVYAGCYSVQAFPNDFPYYPQTYSMIQGLAELGELCTCDGK